MAFTQQQLPPIFQKIITAIEENQGQMTTDEFKYYLQFKLKYTRQDIKNTKRWLKKENYITIQDCGRNKEIINLL